ncbi:hypothetical protein [Roseibium alexandrii]|uniref:Uncharacterized protein n=1 Tax=Roseibium alexandrii TaxID=388408 RepID=A0A0M7APE9_9HYPH|nr:hypothetical protein [Roseibium alexandrii]CTQ75494.1 hypothetical protein LAX5112_04260 [Roseibium alexandrii]
MPTSIEAAEQIAAISTPDKLLVRLSTVCKTLSANGGIDTSYNGAARNHWLAIHLALNLQFAHKAFGAVAPFARPKPVLDRKKVILGYRSDFLNDRQVIDLHFFHCMGHRMCDHQNGLAALQSDPFDLEEARKFARTGGNYKKQLNALKLNSLHYASLFAFGAAAILSEQNKKLRTGPLNQATAIESQIKAKPPSNNANPKTWAEIFVAADLLKQLDIKVTGSAINEMRAVLFGWSKACQTRPDETLRTCRSVHRHLTGIEYPKKKSRKAARNTAAKSAVEPQSVPAPIWYQGMF